MNAKRKPTATGIANRFMQPGWAVSSLYHIDDDLSSALSPMTGVALDGSLTLMGVSIDHLPLLARIAIAKLWTYENQV